MTDPTANDTPAAAALDEVVELAAPIQESFEAYVRRQGHTLSRTAFLLTGDRHLAEDLVQTALAKVAGRWDGIVANGDPTPYVRTVLLRTAIAWRRRRWRGEVPTGQVPDTLTSEPAPDRREQLRVALAALPARQRAVVVLRFYEDLTEVETAAVLGCSTGTVKSQTTKARVRLRALLGGDRFDNDLEDER